jgi:hypothetical protein
LGFLALAAVALTALALAVMAGSAAAQDGEGEALDTEYCLGCHGNEGLTTTLESGEILPLTVDPEEHAGSVHSAGGLTCIDCHTNIVGFPHEPIDPVAVPDLRAWELSRQATCNQCHGEQFSTAMDDVHAEALAAGNREAAVCTDCHDPHYTQALVEHSPEAVETCRTCHSAVYDIYADSIHGEALLNGNRDVPTCTDCHGVHDVEGPSRPDFHLFSPRICAECHEDAELMAKYGVRADVFETYVADFHGTTVVLFEALAPDQETNKAVCIDCHGVHSIQSADDPNSPTFRENLLRTCQRCHPDASANFPSSWLGHYTPAPGQATLVWLATWFYKIVIPVTLGSMGLYVILLTYRDRRNRKEAASG